MVGFISFHTACSLADEGLGANFAGFTKTTVPASSSVMLSVPFHGFDDSVASKVADIMGDQLTGSAFSPFASDQIMRWNPNAQSYDLYWKYDNGSTSQWRVFPQIGETTNTLKPGDGFFVRNAHSAAQELILGGQVPSEAAAPTATVILAEGLTQAAYPYPLGIALNGSSLTNVAGGLDGDRIRGWDVLSQGYVDYFYDDAGTYGGGWQRVDNPGAPTSNRLLAGEAFYFTRTNAVGDVMWIEPKPYTWP